MRYPDPSIFLVHLLSVILELANVLGLKAGSKPGGISPLAASFHAKKFDGFQYLDPALIPVGTYIALDSIPANYTLYQHGGNSSFDLGSLVADIVETEIGDAEEEAQEQSSRTRAASAFVSAPIKGLAGIRPLSTTRLPMGIFIPDKLLNETLTGGADPLAAGIDPEGKIARAVQLKVFRGIRRIVAKLKSVGRQRQSQPHQELDYNATFGGIAPFEAVYLPSGIFVPLSAALGRKSALIHKAAGSAGMFDGIVPLQVMQIPPGVFIGHSLTSLPSLPSSIVPVPPPTVPEYDDSGEEGGVTPTPPPPNITMSRPPENGTTISVIATTPSPKISDSDIENAFIAYVEDHYNGVAETVLHQNSEANWAYETNVTDYNKAALITTEAVVGNFTATVAQVIRSYPFEAIKNATYKRLYLKISNRGDYSLSPARLDELTKVKAKMQEIYSTGVICGDSKVSVADIASCPKEQLWSLSPEITRQMATSRNPSSLLHIWKSWRDATGKKLRPEYLKYLALKNESAVQDGYPDTGMVWREPYVETDYKYSDVDFLQDVKEMWNRTLPLYIHLHAYVRKMLIKRYPEAKIKPNGPIPAHLLGSQWGYEWKNVIEFGKPYQKSPIENPTVEMKRQNWTVSKMAHTAEKFLVDLGLPPMPKEFWDKSVLEKPTDRNISCTATAMDFFNKKDYRIKMCADTTMPDLVELHNQMALIEHNILYKNQLVPFRTGANVGIMLAIGSAITLSVQTPDHLRKLKLSAVPTNFNNVDMFKDINFLYSMALEKVAHLPFVYLVDKYRYDVFAGKIKTDELNSKWWSSVLKNQGLCAPVARTEEDFDAGSKYHVPADVPYMRYFVAGILQFQIHKALCARAGHTGPLYTCNIDGSKRAGELLQEVMSLGASVPWQVVLEKLTGSPKMDASALLEYFDPLTEWLENYNSDGNSIGWDSLAASEAVCPQDSSGSPASPPEPAKFVESEKS